MEEVLKHALVRAPKPIVWGEDASAAVRPIDGDDDAAGVVAH
jgi:hypothetical protein